MRFRVDVMPDYPRECPFHDSTSRVCKLDECSCEYFRYSENGIYTNPLSCDWLIDEATENYLMDQS